MGGTISTVEPGSLAERAGLQAGDDLLTINGHAPRDVIDVRFHAAEEHLAMQMRRGGREFTVEVARQYGEPLGLAFAHPTFDTIRRCNNRCEFCFVSQMPSDLRRSLYVKDDDYRHSFLFGNYVTLTNLDETDWERIDEQRLSPLYVSVHTTDPELRRQVLRNPAAPDILLQLRRLATLGIEVHTQIVVIPGINDGHQLDRSISNLTELYPTVRSVSVVPIGLTRFHRGNCRVHTLDEVKTVFEQVTGLQGRLREQLRVNFVYLSDEWYLRLGEQTPLLDAYDGLDLTENGVGLVSRFKTAPSELQSLVSTLQSSTLVTGALFAPVLQQVIALIPNADVIAVVNHFFGETVTAAGLLTGQDVVAQLRRRELGDVVILPPAMFGGPEGQSLDEMWPQQVGEALGRPVIIGDRRLTGQGLAARSGSAIHV
jgi:putative radical SAM enzyme (TIGR03279 family)